MNNSRKTKRELVEENSSLRETTRFYQDRTAVALLERALIVAERIRSSIEKRAFHWQGDTPGIRVTLSIGASALHAEEDSRADRALYTAKESGRNRACIQA
jgi:diguanylate cyclase (GGDEF)-like protein